jgi:hypothetical protein
MQEEERSSRKRKENPKAESAEEPEAEPVPALRPGSFRRPLGKMENIYKISPGIKMFKVYRPNNITKMSLG